MSNAKVLKLMSIGLVACILLTGCGGKSDGPSTVSGNNPVSTKEGEKAMDAAKVTLGNYTGIKVTVVDQPVTDGAVESYKISMIDAYNQTKTSTKAAIKTGDNVQAEIHIFDEDGNELVDERTMTGIIEVGSGTTYKELEDGIIGASVGSSLEIPITELSENTVCQVTILGVLSDDDVTMENITDEQAMEIFQADSKDHIDEAVRNMLKENKDLVKRQTAYETISKQLLESCTIDPFPQAEVDARVDKQMKQAEDLCNAYYSIPLDEYYEMLGMTEEEYRKSLEDSITETVKLELIFLAIGDKEDIQYEEDAYQEYIKEILEHFHYETEEDFYAEYGESYVKDQFRIEYIINWLIDQAEFNTVSAQDYHPELDVSDAS